MSSSLASARERAERAVEALRRRSLTLGLAESSTGGLLADLLTDIPGVSACFLGAIVAYDNAAKERLLEVAPETLAAEGAVSAPVAAAMAAGARRALGADVGVAVTGIAGPGGGSAGKPVGLTFVAVAGEGQPVVESAVLRGSRRQVKEAAAAMALGLLLRRLERLNGE